MSQGTGNFLSSGGTVAEQGGPSSGVCQKCGKPGAKRQIRRGGKRLGWLHHQSDIAPGRCDLLK